MFPARSYGLTVARFCAASSSSSAVVSLGPWWSSRSLFSTLLKQQKPDEVSKENSKESILSSMKTSSPSPSSSVSSSSSAAAAAALAASSVVSQTPIKSGNKFELANGRFDAQLGYQIHRHLLSLGIETPYDPLITDCTNENVTNNVAKIEKISAKFKEIMEILGLDLSNDSLNRTPYRVAKMYVEEVFWGLNPHNFPQISTVKNSMRYDEMIIERNINVSSHCEHHFVHIDGVAHVGYIPRDKVIGLSKMNRLVRYFSKRPQIQERLTEQIYAALSYVLETKDVGVTISAQHFCVKCRGIEDVNSDTVTSKLGGMFQNDQKTRGEFMRLISSLKH